MSTDNTHDYTDTENQAYVRGEQMGTLLEKTRRNEERIDRVETRIDHVEEHLNRQDMSTENHFNSLDDALQRTASSVEQLATTVVSQNERDTEMREYFSEATKERIRRKQVEDQKERAGARRANIALSIAAIAVVSSVGGIVQFILKLPPREAIIIFACVLCVSLVCITIIWLRAAIDARADIKI